MWLSAVSQRPAIPGPARQDRSARSCHGPLAGAIPRRERREAPRATCARRLRAGPSRQRSASKPRDRARPAGYPAGTCHRPPVDLRRQRSQASPNDPPPGQRLRRCPRPPSSTPAPPQASRSPGTTRPHSAAAHGSGRAPGAPVPPGACRGTGGGSGTSPPAVRRHQQQVRQDHGRPAQLGQHLASGPHLRSSTAVRVRNTRRRRPSSQPGAALLEARAAEIAIIDPVMAGWPNPGASSRSKDSLRHAFRCNADDHERHCPAVRPRCR